MLNGTVMSLGLALLIGAGSAWYVRGLQADEAASEASRAVTAMLDKAREEGEAEGRRQREAVGLIAQIGRVEDAKREVVERVVGGAADGVRQQAAQYASVASCDPGVARRGASATSAARVLSELFGESVERNKILAREADASRARALRCEQSWEAMRGGS